MRVLCPAVCLVLLAALVGCPGPPSSPSSVDRPAVPARPGAPAPEPERAPDDRTPASRASTPPGEPPSAPMLRLEMGLHAAVISHIGGDAAQRYLVTGSYDKTVRVWELASGRLLRTLRSPVGTGNEGRIYAVALSPDGNTIAAAGWTGGGWDKTRSIYLFDRASGRLRQRLTGLPIEILHLAYSRDGAFLVATLHGVHGMRIYRSSDGAEVACDTGYGSDSYGSDFDPSGRLVTTSWDGFVRLYDSDFRLRSPSGAPVTAIKGLVDGRPVTQTSGLQVPATTEDATRELQLTIPMRDCEVAIIAENRYAASVPATIRLRWQGASAQEDFITKPKLYVLAVGVGRYQNPSLTLDFAAKDAQDFTAALRRQRGTLYRDVEVRLLTDAEANREAILDGLEWLQRQTTSKDVAAIFVAGHEANDPNGYYYFLPANIDPERLKSTGVAFTEFMNTVAALAGKVLFFLDTYHSGNIMKEKRRAVLDIAGVINELASAENGAVVFAASTGNQYSLENPSWGNGAFTKALVEGLQGKADYRRSGRITVNMLDLYLSERVKELTQGRQTPTTTKPPNISDFPVALVP